MDFFTTEKLLEYLSPEGFERAIQIANLQDILMALESSNIETICDYLVQSVFLRDPELIPRLVDNIFVCCKYREFYVEQYAFLIYAIHQMLRITTRIQSSINLGFQTKEGVDKNIFTYKYLIQNDVFIKTYVNKDLNCFSKENEKVASRRKSLLLSETQSKKGIEKELNEGDNQIISVINPELIEAENKAANESSISPITQISEEEYDKFFDEFVMNSDSILNLFRDRVFIINQSVAQQPWRLFCIYKCMEIFNNDGYYRYIQEFFNNSIAIEINQMTIFAYFAPLIRAHSPKLFNKLYDEMNKKRTYSRLPYSFNVFFDSFDYSNSTNWKDHSFILENCGFRKGTPLFAIRHDDVDFFIQEQKMRKQKLKEEEEENDEKDLSETIIHYNEDNHYIDYNMRVKDNIYIRYRQLKFRCTLLQLAAYYGSEKCFAFLLANGADPNLEDDIGLNLMHYAVIGGSNQIICHLQKLGFTFDIGAISLIAESYRLDLFQWIISVTQIDYEESFLQTGTIIHRAASSNNILMLLFCIANGVDVNVFDNLDLTPLFYAASNRSIDAINVLLSHKNINWSLADKFKDTPLHGAAKSFDCDTFIAVMNHKDSDVNVKDFRNRTPLRYAVSEGKYDIVRMIISKYSDQVDYSEIDDCGENLGFFTSFVNVLSTFTIICENCPKINFDIPRNDGVCLLHYIVSSNEVEFAKVFLRIERIDPNVKLPNGKTPLHIAAKRGFTEIVQLLIDNKKTLVNISDGYGLTPLHYAIKHINTDVVRVLVNCDRIDLELTVVFFTFIYL